MTSLNKARRRTGQHPPDPAAFSLVELLVVIGVIALLATILLPSVAAVKDMSKRTATQALLHTISSGLDMYKSESKLGRDYPPSFWDTTSDGSPYDDAGGNFVAYGAQTLLWGLVGADILGTPGFPEAGGPDMGNGDGQLYHVSATTGQPSFPRFGPFIDPSKTKIKTPEELGIAVEPLHGTPGNDQVPVILDNFDLPVLYFIPHPDHADIQMYSLADNVGFLSEDDPIADQTNFYNYILDQRAEGLLPGNIHLPHNRDSCLLITAGPDRRYGTRDDVTNFPHNPIVAP